MRNTRRSRSGDQTRRCPDCKALLLVAQTRRGEVLLDKEPSPYGRFVFETAYVDGKPTGARRARFVPADEKLKPGTTQWRDHRWTCKGRKKNRRAPDVEVADFPVEQQRLFKEA